MLRLHNEICWREFNDGSPGRMLRIFLLVIAVSRTTCGSWLDADATKESQTDLLSHPKSRLFCLTLLFLLYAFIFALFLSYPRANEVRPMAKCIFLIYILLNYILFETRSVRFSYKFTKSTGPFICFLSFKIRVRISYYPLTFS